MRSLVDTHVHLDASPLDDDAFARAREAGVVSAIAVGVAPASWTRTIQVARASGVSHALGIHPQVVPELDDAALDHALARLPALLLESGAVAIGECGLDLPAGDLERQRRVLLVHLEIARAMHLPISLHVWKAHGPAIALLRDFGTLPAGGVAHSYSGSPELVRDYLDRGLSISFAGGITRSNAKKPILAARAVPLDRLVIETDAPYQPTGADARDRKHGEPHDLGAVLAALAAARGDDPDALAEATTENARRIFRI
ncbi:MAG: TatD family hydrolase [Polyangiales bacterium]